MYGNPIPLSLFVYSHSLNSMLFMLIFFKKIFFLKIVFLNIIIFGVVKLFLAILFITLIIICCYCLDHDHDGKINYVHINYNKILYNGRRTITIKWFWPKILNNQGWNSSFAYYRGVYRIHFDFNRENDISEGGPGLQGLPLRSPCIYPLCLYCNINIRIKSGIKLVHDKLFICTLVD